MKRLWRRICAWTVLPGIVAIAVAGCNTCIPCGKGDLAGSTPASIPCGDDVLKISSPADHESWMGNRLSTLGGRELSQLVLPASHDAGMYRGWFGYGRTQCLSIYRQLKCGIRWFDLRPSWTWHKFRVHHNFVAGPVFSDVLNDVKKFASEPNHHELILLKLSDLDGINDETYAKLVDAVTKALGPWLFTTLPSGKRLADVTLSEYVKSGSKILVLVDGSYPIVHPSAGIWVYRDWQSNDTCCADLCVSDRYSNTEDFNEMYDDQYAKFHCFNGKAKNGNNVCDLFLLSWTLTPKLKIWAVSQPAITNLACSINSFPLTNDYGKVVNLIYVDFVEFTHVTDVAISRNEQLKFGP